MACTMQASEAFPCLFAWCSCGRIGGTVTLQSLAKTSKEHDADAHPQRAYPQKAGSLASKTEDRQATSNKQQSPKPKATLPSLPEKKPSHAPPEGTSQASLCSPLSPELRHGGAVAAAEAEPAELCRPGPKKERDDETTTRRLLRNTPQPRKLDCRSTWRCQAVALP